MSCSSPLPAQRWLSSAWVLPPLATTSSPTLTPTQSTPTRRPRTLLPGSCSLLAMANSRAVLRHCSTTCSRPFSWHRCLSGSSCCLPLATARSCRAASRRRSARRLPSSGLPRLQSQTARLRRLPVASYIHYVIGHWLQRPNELRLLYKTSKQTLSHRSRKPSVHAYHKFTSWAFLLFLQMAYFPVIKVWYHGVGWKHTNRPISTSPASLFIMADWSIYRFTFLYHYILATVLGWI